MENRKIIYLMFFLLCRNMTGQLIEKERISLKEELEKNTWIINEELGLNLAIKEYKLTAIKKEKELNSLTDENIVCFYDEKYFDSFNMNTGPCLNALFELSIFGMRYTISKENIFTFNYKKSKNKLNDSSFDNDDFINLKFKIVKKKNKIFLQKIN